MTDGLKSALEIALEKLEERGDAVVDKLSEKQKKTIAEIRAKYRARIAEIEINSQSQIKKAFESGSYEEVAKLNQHIKDKKNRLNQKMEEEVEKVRTPNN